METCVHISGKLSRSQRLLRKALKRSLITATVLSACTIGVTSISRPAQAFLNQYSLYAYDCRVGPRSGDVTLYCYTPGTYANPRNVQCQPRNSYTQTTDWPDQFACQIIQTRTNWVRIRIRRLDAPGGGWGQDLHVNLLIANY